MDTRARYRLFRRGWKNGIYYNRCMYDKSIPYFYEYAHGFKLGVEEYRAAIKLNYDTSKYTGIDHLLRGRSFKSGWLKGAQGLIWPEEPFELDYNISHYDDFRRGYWTGRKAYRAMMRKNFDRISKNELNIFLMVC